MLHKVVVIKAGYYRNMGSGRKPTKFIESTIAIASPGWHTVKHQIHNKGQSSPENIPDESGVYVLQISYVDTFSRI